MRIHRSIPGVLALTGAALLAPGAVLADAAQATAVAVQHAGFAADAGDLAGAQRHLHHVLNCLVGPEGEGFDQAAGNPCAQPGGAIPQTSDAAMTEKLQKIAASVRAALGNDDVAAAKAAAADARKMLAGE